MRIMIAGGGTGGHVYPGIAMYNALKRSIENVEVLFVGARAGVESQLFSDLGLPNVLLPGRGVRGKGLAAKLTSPFIFLVGIVRGVREILRFNPDVVIGTGGYASVALVFASVLCKRRRVLHEQNSVPGLANRLLSRFADLVLLSYEESKKYLHAGGRTAVVGNPIRVKKTPDRETSVLFFDLKPDVPTILICGGSRGAKSINAAARVAIPRLLERRDVQFVFLAGELNYAEVNEDLSNLGASVRVFAFLQEMHHAYSVADVAVSRAGASAVFELAAYGVPTVFVPYPYAVDDHQRQNAAPLEKLDAAIVVDDDELNGDQLQTILETLLDDEEKRGRMSGELRKWAQPDADDLAAEKIIGLVTGRLAGSVSLSMRSVGDTFTELGEV